MQRIGRPRPHQALLTKLTRSVQRQGHGFVQQHLCVLAVQPERLHHALTPHLQHLVNRAAVINEASEAFHG
ncbi:hypothetical protein D3C84_342090 [compost metagenome]